MKPLTVLVVDDEPLARERIGRLLVEAGCQVMASLEDGVSMLAWLSANPPVDVMFMDIQMPGPSGLDVLANLENPPLVVFVTAYSEYAIRAFEAAAVDYLLKPVYPDRLAKTLERLESRLVRRLSPEAWRALIPPLPRIKIRAGTGTVLLDAKFVTHFELEDEKVWAVTSDSRLQTTWTTLREPEENFPELGLLRIQRNVLLNPQSVLGFRNLLGGRMRIRLPQGQELDVSRAMTPTLKARLALD